MSAQGTVGSLPLTALVEAYDHVLLDLDGCVRLGEDATPRADEALAALRAADRGIAFVTNGVDLMPEEVVRQLWGLGVRASAQEVVTVGGALQHALAEGAWERCFVIGGPAVHRHAELSGVTVANRTHRPSHADVVVVAAHEGFDYAELRTATRAVLEEGADVLAAGRDATYPMPDGAWPGTGPLVAAIEVATGTTARSVGKPEPDLFRTALDRLGGGRALVVGDRLDSDAAGARATGLDAAIVLSGVTGPAAAQAALDAAELVAIAPTLADLVLA